ncbi:MAG: DUF3179 domain-containing protein [Firmicutes bacterium]|nr:DUF3179 domain-containing protein [Bacillota bacterium]
MYTRNVAGREIELAVSGKLYKDALVMYDRETGTLWAQVDGSALRGPLQGHRLEEIPAVQAPWRLWKQLHPDTLVLRKPAGVRGSPYADYFRDPNRQGLSGTRGDSRLGGKEMVIGLHEAGDAVAIAVARLKTEPLVNTKLNRKPVIVFYAIGAQTAAVFRPFAGGRWLNFRLVRRKGSVHLEDAETGSQWSPLEGRAISGPLAGTQLERVPYLHSFWYAWSAYRPQTRLLR